jgi:ribonuclease Z
VSPGEHIEVSRAGKAALFAQALEHGIDCQGYRLQEDDSRRMLPEKLAAAGVSGPAVRQLLQKGALEVNGRVVRVEEVSESRPGQGLAVVMDTRPCAGAEELARGADLLVCEATYQRSEEKEAFDYFHMTAAGAAEMAVRGGVRRLALTHFSQRYPTLEGFQAEAEAIHGDVFCADDLSRVEVPRRQSKEC